MSELTKQQVEEKIAEIRWRCSRGDHWAKCILQGGHTELHELWAESVIQDTRDTEFLLAEVERLKEDLRLVTSKLRAQNIAERPTA